MAIQVETHLNTPGAELEVKVLEPDGTHRTFELGDMVHLPGMEERPVNLVLHPSGSNCMVSYYSSNSGRDIHMIVGNGHRREPLVITEFRPRGAGADEFGTCVIRSVEMNEAIDA